MIPAPLKPVVFHPTAKAEIRAFPELIKKEMGDLLRALQKGEKLMMPHSKPIPSVGSGVHELRVKGLDGVYRAFYYLKHENAILVVHCFKKKTQKTPLREIRKGIKNLKELIYEEETKSNRLP